MKYNQNKNAGKLFNGILCICAIFHVTMISFILICSDSIFESITKENQKYVLICLFICLLGVLGFYLFTKKKKIFESTIEFTKEKIVLQGHNRTVEMKWEDVETVYISSEKTGLPINRRVIFVTKDGELFDKQENINSERICSEYNDEMIEEIKKYYEGRIINEGSYLKYKNRNGASPSGDYKYKQIFGNDGNRYFRFEIRPNEWMYDEGDYLPKFITNEVYYTRFTTIFGWGENDTLWIYSSDTGIDYWEIEDGSWVKKRVDEESIGMAPERVRQMYTDNRKDKVEM